MTTANMIKNHKGHSSENRKGHKAAGLALSLVGFFWFAKKIGWVPAAAVGTAILWPLVTIATGFFMLFAITHHRDREV